MIPVDWAEAVRALRIVWLRSLRDPAKAFARSAELNMQIWTSAMEAWNSAGARWWGLTTGTTPEPGTEPTTAPTGDTPQDAPPTGTADQEQQNQDGAPVPNGATTE